VADQVEAEVHADHRMGIRIVPVSAVARVLRQTNARVERRQMRLAGIRYQAPRAKGLDEIHGDHAA
jgi:hypothetical protein